MEETRWLTYDGIAMALSINPDSARRLVARRRWPRKPGNDGRSLIAVPADRIPPDRPPDAIPVIRDGATPVFGPDIPPSVTHDMSGALAVLERHVERLERELVAAVTERDVERARAAQVEALRAALDIERQRVTEWQAVADRWASQSERLQRRGWLGWLTRAS